MERRKFTREFKLEAVRLIKERGVSYAQASHDLRVHQSQLRSWVWARQHMEHRRGPWWTGRFCAPPSSPLSAVDPATPRNQVGTRGRRRARLSRCRASLATCDAGGDLNQGSPSTALGAAHRPTGRVFPSHRPLSARTPCRPRGRYRPPICGPVRRACDIRRAWSRLSLRKSPGCGPPGLGDLRWVG
jgi:transposase-like protein